jgi:hypothetical protein
VSNCLEQRDSLDLARNQVMLVILIMPTLVKSQLVVSQLGKVLEKLLVEETVCWKFVV